MLLKADINTVTILGQKLWHATLNIEESMDFAIQFCTGMEYAYQKLGVIHRDIKPANVMVQKNPAGRFGYSFKITDFGLVSATRKAVIRIAKESHPIHSGCSYSVVRYW